MYGREFEGLVTTFGTTGYTYNNIFLLYDRDSETVWYPLGESMFEGVGGPRLGHKISIIEKPKVMTLGEWLTQHPSSSVLLDDASADQAYLDASNAANRWKPTG